MLMPHGRVVVAADTDYKGEPVVEVVEKMKGDSRQHERDAALAGQEDVELAVKKSQQKHDCEECEDKVVLGQVERGNA